MITVSEYDAFGPWIYEVNEEHPLPPLFVPYYKSGDNSLMVIKIPRNLERRNARPDMNLYDYVIGLYADSIYILKRVDEHVEEHRVYYSNIEGIEDHRRLLKGTLTIFLNHTKLTIPYNTVSSNLIVKFIGIIRDKYTQKSFELKSEFGPEEDLGVEVLYRNMLKDIKPMIPDLRVCAVQRSIPLKLAKGNFAARIGHFLSRSILLNCLHLTNNKELIVFTRGRTIMKKGKANYDYSTIYIPIEKLGILIPEKDEKYVGLESINIKLSSQEFRFYFEQTNRKSIDFYKSLNNRRNHDRR
ncbi:hypothetical protein FRZ06_13075 [Anoxybacterium hadale]|uniref:Uncharacterized protein n=1 Tax=Anoxybacterium hadale TaxID=3408580 RepID=A0ACD1AD41_9FIRM|nr:hypothetical protein FRZ06_13075 [Clostridiales bacterium]